MQIKRKTFRGGPSPHVGEAVVSMLGIGLLIVRRGTLLDEKLF